MSSETASPVKSVYIVDDDRVVLFDLAKKISDFGYLACSFDNGKDFLQEFTYEEELCIVFLDINMPEIHGLAILDKIKQNEKCIPVIISSLNDISTYKKALSIGAYDYLVKPVKRMELFDTIEQVIHRHSSMQNKEQNREKLSALIKKLSKREYQVLDLLLEAKNKEQIANALNISKNTVDVHRRNILNKLKCKSVVEVSLMMNQH